MGQESDSAESASDFQVKEQDQSQIVQQQSQQYSGSTGSTSTTSESDEVVTTLPSNATSQQHAALSDLAERDKISVQPCRLSVKFPPTIVGSKRR